MNDPLLATKLYIPPLRSDLLSRPRLTAALDDALREGRRLALVSAPAGFGKTVVVAEWLHARRGKPPAGQQALNAAWLSLDRNDNDPITFWRYVVAACQTVRADVGDPMHTALEAARAQPVPQMTLEPLITSLLNDLAALEPPLVLVLEDYHAIENQAVHDSLSFFIEHLPPGHAVVIMTRVDPPLALARRRARGQLAEVRVQQLRFTSAEIDAYLHAAGLALAQTDITALEIRTEGWIAGLQLAALSLRESDDPHAFITSFAGDDRYVVDYLLEEVLQNLAPAVQRFLLKTSILERLCLPLCETLTAGSEDAAGQGILQQLDRSNLFIVPLDHRRQWFRYHHLFGDLLRRRLRQGESAAAVTELYRRAAGWLEQQGMVSEAISQALAGQEYETAADIIERHILTFFYRSETLTVYRWLQALPESLLRARPLLCAVYACVISLAPPYPPLTAKAARAWLALAEEALQNADNRQNLARGFMDMFQAYLARFEQQPVEQILAVTRRSLAGLPPETVPLPAKDQPEINFYRFRSALNANLGATLILANDIDAARQALQDARRIGLASGDLFNAAAGTNGLATLAILHGNLPEAAAICREYLAILESDEDIAQHPVPYAATVGLSLGSILTEWNQLDEARQVLRRHIELVKHSLTSESLFGGMLAMARLYFACGDVASALHSLDDAERSWPFAAAAAHAERIAFYLRLRAQYPEYRKACIEWAQTKQLIRFDRLAMSGEKQQSMVLAMIVIALCQDQEPPIATLPSVPELIDWLDEQRKALEDRGWLHWAIEVGVVQSLAYLAMRDERLARAALRRALHQAQPGGYARIFTGQGPVLLGLLDRIPEDDPHLAGYCQTLGNAIRSEMEAEPKQVEEIPSQENRNLVEPLSNREMEVLRLLVEGASNNEIAAQLVIAPSTAKKHVINILGKLGVTSRSKAVSRARELHLIA